MIYLLAWCLPSFVLSALAALFARRVEGKQRGYWLLVVLIGYLPLPVLAFLAMFGLGLMREVDMSLAAAIAFIIGLPFITCSFGMASALVFAMLKPVHPKPK